MGFNERTSQQSMQAKQGNQLTNTLKQQGLVAPNSPHPLASFPETSATKSGIIIPKSTASQIENQARPAQEAHNLKGRNIQSQLEAEAQKARDLESQFKNQQKSGMSSMNASNKAVDTSTTNLAKAGATAEDVSKVTPQGMMAKIAKTPVIGRAVNALGGAGLAMNATELMNRYEKGDTKGAILSGAKMLADAMAMVPPTTPPLAVAKALGMGGGLALEVVDYFMSRE
jgi:hypothetical protein